MNSFKITLQGTRTPHRFRPDRSRGKLFPFDGKLYRSRAGKWKAECGMRNSECSRKGHRANSSLAKKPDITIEPYAPCAMPYAIILLPWAFCLAPYALCLSLFTSCENDGLRPPRRWICARSASFFADIQAALFLSVFPQFCAFS